MFRGLGGEPIEKVRFAEQPLKRVHQFVGDGIVVFRPDQHAVNVVFDQFTDRAHRGHNRHAANTLRFQDGERCAFPARGEDQDVGFGKGIGNRLASNRWPVPA